MAQKVPGLINMTGDALPGSSPRSRAPRRAAQDLPEERSLRPTAAPVNTYVRPAEAPKGNDFLDLAFALRDFSPVLTEAFANVEAKQKTGAEAAVAASTQEDLQAHVRNGTAPISVGPMGRKEYAKLAAQQLATSRITSLEASWSSGEFDRDNGDFDAFIAGKAQEDLANIKDEDARNAYGAVLNKFSPRLRAQQTDYRVKKEREGALTMIGDTWFAAVASGISEGKTPEELQGALRGQYGRLKDTMGLQPQELDGVILNVSRRLAETPGNERYVEHFLNDTRGGVGSIAAKQDSGPAAQVVINRAQASTKAYQAEQLRIQNKANADADEARVEAGLEVAAENGTLAFMTPVEVRTEAGNTKTVSADDQQKRGVEMIRKKAEGMAAQGSPEGGMNYRVQALSKNGLVDPQLKSILSAGPSTASHEALAKGEVPPALKAGASLYESLYARNPRLLAQHVGSTEEFFYEAYRVARQDMGYDENAALLTATRFTDTANPQSIPASLRPNLNKVRETLGALSSGSSWLNPFSWGNGEAMTMTDDVARKLDRWGEFYVRLGKSPDEAVELAKERIQAGHAVINGNPVPTTDAAMPGNFKAIAEGRIKQWADTYGARYGYTAGSLTVEPAGDGQQGVWTIVRSNGDGPVLVMEEDARAALNFSLRAAKAEYEDAEKARILRSREEREAQGKASIQQLGRRAEKKQPASPLPTGPFEPASQLFERPAFVDQMLNPKPHNRRARGSNKPTSGND